MALLDSMFDPSMYRGLGILPSLNGQPMPGMMQPGGFPALPQQQQQPDPAALPQNAQPVQHPPLQMMPQQQQPEAPQQGFMESMGLGPNALMALGAGIAGGNSLGDSVSKGVGGLVAARQQNQTEAALVKRGLDPQMAKTVASNPAMMNALIPRLFGTTGQTDDIKEYEYAKREDPGLTFDKFMARKKSVSGEYGMQPIWGVGPDGKPAVLQLGKSGDAKQSVLPQGFSLARDPIKVEGPTGTTVLDPQTRQVVGFIPKDIAGAKVAEAKGEAQGAAQVALPQVLANAEQTLATIKSIKTDPYRERGTGASSMFNVVPGTGGYDFAQKVEQLKGKTFLEAFQSLKGGGAITEMEGRKAENAIARLSVAQSEGAFMEALNELETVVTAGMERSKRKAGVSTPQAATTTAPNVADLKSKYGLK